MGMGVGGVSQVNASDRSGIRECPEYLNQEAVKVISFPN